MNAPRPVPRDRRAGWPGSGWFRRVLRSDGLIDDIDDQYSYAIARSLAARLPVLYIALIVTMWLEATAYFGSAPPVLTIVLPAMLSAVMLMRIRDWRRFATAGQEERRKLKDAVDRIAIVGPLIAVLVIGWAAALYSYGNPAQQSLTHQFSAVTGVLCAICLLPVPRLALTVSMSGLAVATASFMFQPHPNALRSGLIQIVVMAVVLYVTYRYRQEFVDLLIARRESEKRERDATRDAEEQRELAGRDFLTGLLNRRAFHEALDEAVAQAAPDGSVGVALIDLDGFKEINDTHGHAAGDWVLIEIANRLREALPGRTIGRLGGDEFAVLTKTGQAAGCIADKGRRTLARLNEPIAFDGWTLRVDASIGYVESVASLGGSELIDRADRAMYEAKRQGGSRFVRFDERLERELTSRRAISAAIRRSAFEKDLAIVYQPIVDVVEARVSGIEALVRWSSPELGEVDTATFIRTAEESGLIREVSLAVTSRALRECRNLPGKTRVGLNISALDLASASTIEQFMQVVDRSGFPADRIVLEVTETGVLELDDRPIERLEMMKAAGFRVALDDFGTGQSSLSRVHRLPVDSIKIDGSFAACMLGEQRARAIVSAIVALGREMGVTVVMEGIESVEQELMARQAGIRLLQGFHIARPMPITDALSYVERAVAGVAMPVRSSSNPKRSSS